VYDIIVYDANIKIFIELSIANDELI